MIFQRVTDHEADYCPTQWPTGDNLWMGINEENKENKENTELNSIQLNSTLSFFLRTRSHCRVNSHAVSHVVYPVP